MKNSVNALLTFLLAVCSLTAAAQGVAFRDGEEYELRCLEWPWGCVVPVPDAEVAGLSSFVYKPDARECKSEAYWRVKRVRKGEYALQHSASRGYLSYDGRRTATHRYATLSALVRYNRINSTQEAASGLETWNNQIRLSAQYELPWGIDVRSQFILRHFTGSGAEGFDPTRCIWNATVSKSLLRNKNLTQQLELSDLLNQRDQSWANAFVGGRNSGWVDCVGRFAMLHVIYSFNTKKK